MTKKKSKAKNPSNALYKAENRTAKNKAIKIATHQKEHPSDTTKIGEKPNYRRRKPEERVFGGVQKIVSSPKQQTKR